MWKSDAYAMPKMLEDFVCFDSYVFVCFDSLHPCQQFFSHVGTGLSGLNQY